MMGEGWVGVNVNEGLSLSSDATPPHGQVALSPGQGFGSRGDPNLFMVGVNVDDGRNSSGDSTPPQPLPIKGRGFIRVMAG